MTFDPNTFLETSYEESMATEQALFPEGEYEMELTDIEIKPTKNTAYAMLIMKFQADDAHLAELLGRSSSTVKSTFRVLVEIDQDRGGYALGEGKNILLGQFRAACGQNNPAAPWRTTDLIGNNFLLQIAHRTNKETNQTSSDIKRVVAAN